MRLIHWSKEPLGRVRSSRQSRSQFEMKPNGFWVSDEDDTGSSWLSWSMAEQFRLENLEHATEVILAPEPRLLVLSNKSELKLFVEEFGLPFPWGDRGSPHPIPERMKFRDLHTDWRRVSQRYRGILIMPYDHRLRFDLIVPLWYYAWDCSSGCIWNVKAIQELRPLSSLEVLKLKARYIRELEDA